MATLVFNNCFVNKAFRNNPQSLIEGKKNGINRITITLGGLINATNDKDNDK